MEPRSGRCGAVHGYCKKTISVGALHGKVSMDLEQAALEEPLHHRPVGHAQGLKPMVMASKAP